MAVQQQAKRNVIRSWMPFAGKHSQKLALNLEIARQLRAAGATHLETVPWGSVQQTLETDFFHFFVKADTPSKPSRVPWNLEIFHHAFCFFSKADKGSGHAVEI